MPAIEAGRAPLHSARPDRYGHRRPPHGQPAANGEPIDHGWYSGDPEIVQAAPARVFHALLGGMQSFAADRHLCAQLLTAVPDIAWIAQTQREFAARATQHVLAAGIGQILDLGCGLLDPLGSVHHLLHRDAPHVRVVHVDLDPVAVASAAHVIAQTGRADRTAAIHADLRDPHQILNHPEVQRVLDLQQPLAVLVLGVLHYLCDRDQPAAVLAAIGDSVVAGSYLALSHLSVHSRPTDVATLTTVAGRAGISLNPRTRTDIAGLFGDFGLMEPGLVWAPQWRPDANQSDQRDPAPDRSCVLVGVARTTIGTGRSGEQPAIRSSGIHVGSGTLG